MKRKVLSILFAVVLVAGLCLVTAVPAAAADINVPGDYTTIQAAIDAASNGDTIIVGDGTYTEDLTISGLTNLTIRSVNGSASTIIQLVDGVGIDIQGTAGGFTLGGAAGQGFTILSGTTTSFMIQLANAPSDVEISYNTINSQGNASMGISVGAAGATGLTVSNNTFAAEVGDGSIWGPEMVNVTVSNNTFTGPGSYAIQFWGVTATSTSTISGNTISGYGMGVIIANGEGTSNLTISGNDISSCNKGIRFYNGVQSGHTAGNMTTVTVTENTLTANNIGLLVGDGTYIDADQFTIENNNFSGNNTGLQNAHTSEVVTAADNWWGHASGPAYPPEHPGLGDPISDNVVYCPWLDAAYPSVVQTGRVLNQTQNTVHCTIQAALDAASDGDTIIAGDGVFTEDLKVVTPNITLRSENGKDATTITTTAKPGIEIQGTAGGFTLGGAAGQGFTIEGDAAHLIVLANNPHPVTISYCDIDLTGAPSIGIACGAASLEDLTVDHCTFNTPEAGEVVIYGENVHDSVISNCEFIGAGKGTSTGTGVMIWGCPNMAYSGNTFAGIGTGISIWSNSLIGEIDNNTISGCTFTDCTRGLWLGEGYANKTPITGVTVSGSTFTGNTTGIQIDDSPYIDTSNFLIDGNTICGGTYGIMFAGGTGGTISNNLICQNGSFGAGIWLEELVSEVVIIDNCIIENSHGIYVEGCYNIIGRQGEGNVIGGNNGFDSGVHLTNTAFGNVINYNDIAFNFDPSSGGFGVFNENPVPVDATNNWWGHVDGPSLGFIPFVELPAGDTISQYVAYEPWLTSQVADTTTPIITYAAASPSMVSLWSDDMFWDMWGCNTSYSVGPSCYTVFSVKASDDLCGIAMVTINKRALLFDMIPEEKLQKFIDQLDPEDLEDWEGFLAALENIEMGYHEEYGCWYEEECLCAVLLITLMGILHVNPIELAEIMGQELKLGKFDIEVTAYDYSGNSDTTDIAITIVDFQMPVCEGWNLRSTWLDLENNKWQDIVAMDDGLDADSILRWNNELQRWEQYMEVDDVGYWYYGVTQVAPALMQTLESYWIHGLYNDQFGLITFRGVSAPPSRQLYAGWNLIGTALAWHQPGLRVDDALISIYEGEEHCTGYTQVLSIDQVNWWAEEYYICGTYPYEYPCEGDYCWCDGLPNNNGNGPGYYKCFWQDTWVYTRRGNPDGPPPPPPPPPPVTRGGGYWVFMANPAVLAGFNSTPLPVEFWFQWLQCGD